MAGREHTAPEDADDLALLLAIFGRSNPIADQ